MMKAMLSQPMAGKTDEEIIATREKAVAALKAKGYEIVNTLFTDEWYSNKAMEERGVVQIPLCFLAKSLENMSLCHAAYFCKGWEKARGCRIEHDAAVAYGLDIIYEDEPDGTITIDTELDKDGFKKGSDKLIAAVDDLTKAVDTLSESMAQCFSEKSSNK